MCPASCSSNLSIKNADRATTGESALMPRKTGSGPWGVTRTLPLPWSKLLKVWGNVLSTISLTESPSTNLLVPHPAALLYAMNSYVWSSETRKPKLAAAPTTPIPFPSVTYRTPRSMRRLRTFL